MAELFKPFSIKGITIRNRIMLSPMCQYSADGDGMAADWHLVHYGARAAGGAGLLMLEATAVQPEGRISENDLGLWNDGQVEGLARIARFCRRQGATVGIQLAHAGRKAWSARKGRGPSQPVAPSAVPFDEESVVPRELTIAEMDEIIQAFRRAAVRAMTAGFDVVEIHAAHGYLLHEFLSPLSNRRQDEYGGSLANRLRFPNRVIDAVRSVWPEDRPLFIRVSASDYTPGGIVVEEMVEMVRSFQARGIDLVDTSSGGLIPAPIPLQPGYQVPFAEKIKRETGAATAAVGLITTPEQAEEIVAQGRADLVALGRELLRTPQWPLTAARRLGVDIAWPVQYLRAKD